MRKGIKFTAVWSILMILFAMLTGLNVTAGKSALKREDFKLSGGNDAASINYDFITYCSEDFSSSVMFYRLPVDKKKNLVITYRGITPYYSKWTNVKKAYGGKKKTLKKSSSLYKLLKSKNGSDTMHLVTSSKAYSLYTYIAKGVSFDQKFTMTFFYDKSGRVTFILYEKDCIEAQGSGGNSVSVESIKLKKKKITLKVGEKVKVKYSVKPSNATNKKVEWSVSDSSVAKVNSKGVITAKSPGLIVLSVCSLNNGSVSANCDVKVKKK